MLLGVLLGDEGFGGPTESEIIAACAGLDQRDEQVSARHDPPLSFVCFIVAEAPGVLARTRASHNSQDTMQELPTPVLGLTRTSEPIARNSR